jgi:hypothetical protein
MGALKTSPGSGLAVCLEPTSPYPPKGDAPIPEAGRTTPRIRVRAAKYWRRASHANSRVVIARPSLRMRVHMALRGFLLITTSLALFCVLGGTAFAAKQYVLKHPSHEHCKAHHIKKVETIKRHEHGRTVKVHETFCVFVAPKAPVTVTPTHTPAPVTTPTPQAPAVTPPVEKPGPLTTTTLTIGPPQDCELELLDGGLGAVNSCLYAISATVNAGATVLPAAAVVFVFTNPGEPGKEWTVNGVGAFELRAQTESILGEDFQTSVSIPDVRMIAFIPGKAPWSITATYAGATGFDPSESAPQTVL